MASRVIAIDGPAGSGKTSTAKAVAGALGLTHLDSGALYRALTLVMLDSGLRLDARRILEAAKSHGVGLQDVHGSLHPFVDAFDVSKLVRSQEVTEQVSNVAALSMVRDWVNEMLRRVVAEHPAGAVADGRDVGTVIFPDAVLKVFLTADLEERALRRAKQRGDANADDDDIARLARTIQERDTADSTRAVAPLMAAPDALRLDTTKLSFQEQVRAVVDKAKPLLGIA
jgi:cytidylate kinase